MEDTTSLSALPQNNGQNNENITLQTKEIPSMNNPSMNQPQTLDNQPTNMKQDNPPKYTPITNDKEVPQQLSQNMINQLISGIQTASKGGGTDLPSRDIPIDTSRISQDEQVKPNFIPEVKDTQNDYIKKHETQEEVEKKYMSQEKTTTHLDNLYDEIQTPLLIGVLFFVFQLPFFQKFIRKNFTSLYQNDGNINMYGYLFKATLFSGIYYGLQKAMRQLSEI